MPEVFGSNLAKKNQVQIAGGAMSSAWGTLFSARCRHHVYLRTVAVGDEPITSTAVAVVMWTAAWCQFVELCDPIPRLHMPNLCAFMHQMEIEAVQLMGATAVGHDEYLQQSAVIGETVAEIDRASIIDELRNNIHRIARWRCELNVIRANAVDRCIGALGATGENLYDFVPELFVQIMSDLSTNINSAINDQLLRQSNSVIPLTSPLIYPTGGSSGTAATLEQAYDAYRNRMRTEAEIARDRFP